MANSRDFLSIIISPINYLYELDNKVEFKKISIIKSSDITYKGLIISLKDKQNDLSDTAYIDESEIDDLIDKLSIIQKNIPNDLEYARLTRSLPEAISIVAGDLIIGLFQKNNGLKAYIQIAPIEHDSYKLIASRDINKVRPLSGCLEFDIYVLERIKKILEAAKKKVTRLTK